MADQARGVAFPLYQRVATERARQGWTWTRLTARAGVARSTINSWAHITTPPQPEKVNAVADLLGIPRLEALELAGILESQGVKEPAKPAGDAEVVALEGALSAGEKWLYANYDREFADEVVREFRARGIDQIIRERNERLRTGR